VTIALALSTRTPAPDLEATFADLMAQLYAMKYTGPVILHCGEGVPGRVEFPSPSIMVKLDRRQGDRRQSRREGGRRATDQ